ncbi:coiled-coil domain-containing protein 39-like [Polyergus mexicanus]|uniref:coiled-coil domain-containing protein 39-like n=1 Tax=Polyergus mexicanus TaxID=615972 RepID=UPI0038B68DE9
MRFVRQPIAIKVTNLDNKTRPSKETRRHGRLLPSAIRCVICGPSSCGKTNALISLLESPHGVRFENVYVYSKSLQQPKYQYLENLLTPMEDIGYFTFSNNFDVISPSEVLPNSIFVFDDNDQLSRIRRTRQSLSRELEEVAMASTDIGEREKTAKEIAKTRASIRKKHRALKTGKMESEIAIESRFKPIVEPLRRIADRAERDEIERNEIKREMIKQDATDISPSTSVEEKLKDEALTPVWKKPKAKRIRARRRLNAVSTPLNESFVERDPFARNETEEYETFESESLESPSISEIPVKQISRIAQDSEISHGRLGPLGRKYMGTLLGGEAPNEIDHVYGVYIGEKGAMLGDKRFDSYAEFAMSVSKFGSPLKNRGYDARTGRLRPAIESLRSYVRDNALCLSSSIEYDARERKIKRLAQPEEDADATSKSYVEGITSQLRKDANEAAQGVILLFTRLAQLDSALDAVENSISRIETSANALDKRIDVLDKRIKGLSDQIEVAKKTISLNATEFSTRNANDRKIMFNQGKTIQELSQKSRIAANSAVKSETKIRELENSTSRLKRDADELSGRVRELAKISGSGEPLERKISESGEPLERKISGSGEPLEKEISGSGDPLEKEISGNDDPLEREISGSGEPLEKEIQFNVILERKKKEL